VVNRELAEQAEATREEVQVAVRAEYDSALERLDKEMDELQDSRRKSEEMLAQVGVYVWWACLAWK
jgi:hypothetical protein